MLASPAAKRIARETGVELAAVTGTGPRGRITARDVEAVAESTRVKVSPVARRMAQEAGLDLSKVTGTGPAGRITKEDVEREMARPAVPDPAQIAAGPIEAEQGHGAAGGSTFVAQAGPHGKHISRERDRKAELLVDSGVHWQDAGLGTGPRHEDHHRHTDRYGQRARRKSHHMALVVPHPWMSMAR